MKTHFSGWGKSSFPCEVEPCIFNTCICKCTCIGILYLVFVGVSQESDISDKKVTCNGVADEGNPGDCEGEYKRVLGSLACYVGNL